MHISHDCVNNNSDNLVHSITHDFERIHSITHDFERIYSITYDFDRTDEDVLSVSEYINESSYIRHLSYCFYIVVNRICVAISRVDGALKPWSAIHLGVGNSKQKLAYLICLFQLCKVCFGSWGGRNHYCDSTAQMAMEHGEHDKAQKKSLSSTASGLSSRCPDTVLPLDPARLG